jgi:hypothetical protein
MCDEFNRYDGAVELTENVSSLFNVLRPARKSHILQARDFMKNSAIWIRGLVSPSYCWTGPRWPRLGGRKVEGRPCDTFSHLAEIAVGSDHGINRSCCGF